MSVLYKLQKFLMSGSKRTFVSLDRMLRTFPKSRTGEHKVEKKKVGLNQNKRKNP